MTNANPSESRLDRLEVLAETVLLAIQQQNTQIGELRETVIQQGEQMQQSISEVVGMVSDLAQQQAELSQQHAESDQRFENLLQDARADRQRIDEALAQRDRDRTLNEAEHRAFRETFQTLLAEVARIWQRLVG